jgi:hypothetical protein
MDTERELFDNGDDEAVVRNNFGDEDSVRAMLEQKDRDLMLAAELGKALLEKNSDLEKKLEQTVEEYNQHIEVQSLACMVSFSITMIFCQSTIYLLAGAGVWVVKCPGFFGRDAQVQT